ncbi:hypothetical protein EAT51_08870 [Pseudoxanthomonas winnipegensis]|uniref:Uncharacterized protein n=1 Tax=Pseudoxanthomonas winnipegensis TaxID=2480810 RepID=A0A4V2HE95_9GAMM|nr:hypothetical protein EA662_09620 [Pseudoxanthomonas winnipegensis]TAA31303.1 hypothetical protein EA661_06925 [Pseudoxanthomonas winnipegensis]TAA41181.1 hypothetical protein EAT51_08870 [Pseudoxanthomonas winnipegensis]TBV77393.1 hypothetical protein EYC46_06095 [Pseudoxanthomonas winnipegensis]
MHAKFVIPANAGIQGRPSRPRNVPWIPAFAGMTVVWSCRCRWCGASLEPTDSPNANPRCARCTQSPSSPRTRGSRDVRPVRATSLGSRFRGSDGFGLGVSTPSAIRCCGRTAPRATHRDKSPAPGGG